MSKETIVICSSSDVFTHAMRQFLAGYDVLMTGIPPDLDGDAELAIWYQEGELDPSLSTITEKVPTVVVADPSQLVPAVEQGCRGFVDIGVDLNEIENALVAVLRGEAHVSAPLLGSLLRYLVSRRREMALTDPAFGELTKREKQVFELASTGKRRQEIASELFISSATVRTHLQNLYRKLGVHSQAELAALARNDQRDQLADES